MTLIYLSVFLTVSLSTHFCPDVACSITTRPRTTSTLLSLTAPGYVANLCFAPQAQSSESRCSGKFCFKYTIVTLDFAKTDEVAVRADAMLSLPAAVLQPDTDPWSQPRPTAGQAGPHSGGVRHTAGWGELLLFCFPVFYPAISRCGGDRDTEASLRSPCSTGGEGGRRLAQLADETGAAAAASRVPRHLDPVSQPADHDPVPAQRLRTGAVQHARVLLHLLVRLPSRVLHALQPAPVKERKSCGWTFQVISSLNACCCFTGDAFDCRYLSEFLYAWLMSTLSRADSSQIAEERILEEQLKGRSSKKTKKKKKGLFSSHHPSLLELPIAVTCDQSANH